MALGFPCESSLPGGWAPTWDSTFTAQSLLQSRGHFHAPVTAENARIYFCRANLQQKALYWLEGETSLAGEVGVTGSWSPETPAYSEPAAAKDGG